MEHRTAVLINVIATALALMIVWVYARDIFLLATIILIIYLLFVTVGSVREHRKIQA
jgi:hypothetical protein